MLTAVRSIEAREILDSRGNPTVEVKVAVEGLTVGLATGHLKTGAPCRGGRCCWSRRSRNLGPDALSAMHSRE
jgi:enolase